VVGQEPIARTLKSAIEQGKVAHAYLFTGTRGVGKTSMARIFAKALTGGSAEVDAAIMSGQDTDVIEIDGASNRGVDEARELIANSIYRPMRGPYKVYIIDEVHMLTREAFNALLKTMEEPPEHVKFILCTTEAQKVPATIQSRCQRFDFRAIGTGRIAEHLSAVLEKEGLGADPELVHEVARLGNGSMRDALSLLDRLIASGEKRLTLQILEDLLGLPDRELVSDLIDAIADGDAGTVLARGDELIRKGVGPEQLLETLASRLRDLMVLRACGGSTEVVDLSEQAREAEAARAERFEVAGLVHMIALCESVQRNVRASSAPRALLDAALVRMAMTGSLADAAALALGGAGVRTNSRGAVARSAEAKPQRVGPGREAEKKKLERDSASAVDEANGVLSVPAPERGEHGHAGAGVPWAKVVDSASTRQVRMLLESVEATWAESGQWVVTPKGPMGAMVRRRISDIEAAVRGVCGPGVRVELIDDGLDEGADGGDPGVDAGKNVDPSGGEAPDVAQAGEHPLVKKAAELFGARVVNVQRKDRVDASR